MLEIEPIVSRHLARGRGEAADLCDWKVAEYSQHFVMFNKLVLRARYDLFVLPRQYIFDSSTLADLLRQRVNDDILNDSIRPHVLWLYIKGA